MKSIKSSCSSSQVNRNFLKSHPKFFTLWNSMVAHILCFGVCLKTFVWTQVRFQRNDLNKVLITWVKSVISSGNSWQKGNLCSFMTCLYVLLFAFYYQVKISFFYWPSHQPVKTALLHKKEKDTESKARCTKIEHTFMKLSLVLSLQSMLF